MSALQACAQPAGYPRIDDFVRHGPSTGSKSEAVLAAAVKDAASLRDIMTAASVYLAAVENDDANIVVLKAGAVVFDSSNAPEPGNDHPIYRPHVPGRRDESPRKDSK